MAPSSILIVGGSKGLGLALVTKYAGSIDPSNVWVTTRSEPREGQFPEGVRVISGVDCMKEDCGARIVKGLGENTVQVVVYVSGLLKPEEFGKADWNAEIAMYTICAVAPVFVVQSLVQSSSLAPGAKILILTSEGGSITLRTESEGGGMYGHHGSKAAEAMIGKLLAFDLKEKGVPVVGMHPGFLKTEMTKGAGMEQFYEDGGAVTPEEAAGPFAEFVEKLDISMTGRHWAPMGGRGIGNAEEVMGNEAAQQTTPLALPW